MSDDNLKLWNSVSETDKNYTKPGLDEDFEYTAINPTYQIQKASKEWGPFGDKWGLENVVFNNIIIGESVTVKEMDSKQITNKVILLMCNYTAVLYYPSGKFPIEAAKQITFMEGRADSHYSKKVATDALTKGLSKLGFSADIYMQKYEYKPKKGSKRLKGYTKKDTHKSSKDPLDSPASQPDDNKPRGKNVKKEVKEKPLSKVDKDFIDAVNKRVGYSDKKKKDLIDNKKITSILKKQFIAGKMDL